MTTADARAGAIVSPHMRICLTPTTACDAWLWLPDNSCAPQSCSTCRTSGRWELRLRSALQMRCPRMQRRHLQPGRPAARRDRQQAHAAASGAAEAGQECKWRSRSRATGMSGKQTAVTTGVRGDLRLVLALWMAAVTAGMWCRFSVLHLASPALCVLFDCFLNGQLSTIAQALY